jgi:hypothetical protein
MKQVGSTMIEKVMRSGKKTRGYLTYKDVPKNEDGWAESREFLPKLYDLVWMVLNDDKTIIGWHTGTGWEGYRFKKEDVVGLWKKTEDVNFDPE